MRTFSQYVAEAGQPKRLPSDAPMQFADFEKAAEAEAKKQKCGLDSYPSGDRKWIAAQRKRFLEAVWHSCLRQVKPNGFDSRFAEAALAGDLQPFYADEVRVEEWSPSRWRAACISWLASSFRKNEKRWVESRYDTKTDRNGREFVASKW